MHSFTPGILPPFIIAVDGLAGTGKGTLAKLLAAHYGFSYLDTGVLYRKLAWHMQHLDYENPQVVIGHLANVDMHDEVPVHNLQNEQIGHIASTIAPIPLVRQFLYDLQVNFPVGQAGAILDGRDIGTVIFPNAHIKLFINATAEARAKRRATQLGSQQDFASILEAINLRDARDQERAVAPTVPAKDAVLINNSDLAVEETLQLLINLTEYRIANYFNHHTYQVAKC